MVPVDESAYEDWTKGGGYLNRVTLVMPERGERLGMDSAKPWCDVSFECHLYWGHMYGNISTYLIDIFAV